jgi:hypothetical protein
VWGMYHNDLYMGRAPFLGMFHMRSSVQ